MLLGTGVFCLGDLELIAKLAELLRHGLHAIKLGRNLIETNLLGIELGLGGGKLRELSERGSQVVLGTARDGTGGVENIAIESDSPRLGGIADLAGCVHTINNDAGTKNVFHGASNLLVEPNELNGGVGGGAHLLRDGGCMFGGRVGNTARLNLVQGDDGNTAPQFTLGKKSLTSNGLIDNNLVKASPGDDLEGRGMLGLLDANELGNNALHLAPIKATNGIGVVEGKAALQLSRKSLHSLPQARYLVLEIDLFCLEGIELLLAEVDLRHLGLDGLHLFGRLVLFGRQLLCRLLFLLHILFDALHRLGEMRDLHLGLLGSGFGIVGIAVSLANLIGQRHALVALSRADTGAHVLVLDAQPLGLLLGSGRLGLGSVNGSRAAGDFLLLGHDDGLALDDEGVGGLEVLLGAGNGLLAVLPSRGGLHEGLGLLLLGSLGGLVMFLHDAAKLGGRGLDLLLLGGDLLPTSVDGRLVLRHLLLEGIDLSRAGGNDLPGIGIVAGHDEAFDALDVGVVLGPLEVVLLLPSQSLEGGRNLLGKDGVELVDLGLLLLDGLDGGDALGLVHARTGGLLDHAEDFVGLHVEDLGDAALHDEEVGIVDVELDGVEEVGHLSGGGIPAVDEILAPAA
mmetsp:Transcript_31414/g.92086  ORF Transcript_31414/g.92086 Transcript_31414/m.92086 type:complete len:625 (+) Transcript_31414:1709-3583(+)